MTPERPRIRTAVELLATLEAGNWDEVVGVAEGGSIDFKSHPYLLDTDAGKYELAKDVAAFAGTPGMSTIVLPVHTEARTDSPFEHAVEVRPAAANLLDPRRHRDVVASHIYPSVRDLDIRLIPAPGKTDKYVQAIVIPEQRDGDRPFIVLGPLGAGGSKIQGWLIGVPTRSGDGTEQIRPSELHELIVRGRSVAGRLDEIATMLARDTNAARPAVPILAELQARDLFGRPDQQGGIVYPPTFFLTAHPVEQATIPRLFARDGVMHLLETPPFTRHDGWNLVVGTRAELIEGSRLELKSSYKALELSEDGTFIAWARIPGFISRDVIPAGPEQHLHKINPLALVEFVHDFVIVYQAIADYIEPRPESARWCVGLRHVTGNASLPRGPVGGIGWATAELNYEMLLPDSPAYTWCIDDAVNKPAGEIAYSLLERVYAYFKHPTDAIPYLDESRSSVVIPSGG